MISLHCEITYLSDKSAAMCVSGPIHSCCSCARRPYLAHTRRNCLTKQSMYFIMLINVKMSTIVGILTFISMINTISESLKRKSLFSSILVFEQLKFQSQLS